MKSNDMRSMLSIMRDLKKSTSTLLNEQDISTNLDETTVDSIQNLFPDGIILNNISVNENKSNANITGDILSLDIEYNMVLNKSINESNCTVDFRNMIKEGSTVYSIDQDFINSLMDINNLYNTYREVHKYVLDNNILNFEEESTDDQN